jgi:hypothetical protein
MVRVGLRAEEERGAKRAEGREPVSEMGGRERRECGALEQGWPMCTAQTTDEGERRDVRALGRWERGRWRQEAKKRG